MKNVYLFLLLLLLCSSVLAQQQYTIRGKVERISKSGHIYVDGNQASIKSDGTFEITSEVTNPHLAIIHTDSSGSDGVWLEPGDYMVDFQEYSIPGVKPILFKTIITSGPIDAELLSNFQIRIAYNNIGGQQELARKYMDSVFQYFPHAGSLVYILAEAYHYVGDSAMERYISLLSPEIRSDGEIGMIEGEIKRHAKLNAGEPFEDFSMKTPDGSLFQLSSLKEKKAVILDFWAKGCAPCRAAHPGLMALYKKYKSSGLEIVSISLDDKREDWLGAIEKDQIGPWINVSDLQGFDIQLVKDYSISYIPFHFLLSGDRTIIKVYQGGDRVTDKDIEDLLHTNK